MENKTLFILIRLFYLFLTTLTISTLYTILLEFETNQVKTIQLSFFENFILFPLMMTLMLLPSIMVIGLVSSVVKLIIKKYTKVRSILFDICYYCVIGFIALNLLPNIIKLPTQVTKFDIFNTPYLLIPFLGAIMFALLENIKFKKGS